jgi:hypothetical protein
MKASELILFIVCLMALPMASAQLDEGDLGGIDPNDTGSGTGDGSDLPPDDSSTTDNTTSTDDPTTG